MKMMIYFEIGNVSIEEVAAPTESKKNHRNKQEQNISIRNLILRIIFVDDTISSVCFPVSDHGALQLSKYTGSDGTRSPRS